MDNSVDDDDDGATQDDDDDDGATQDDDDDDDDDGANQDDDDGFTHLEHLDLVLGGKFVAFTHVCSQFVRQSLNSAYRHFKRVTRFFPLPALSY